MEFRKLMSKFLTCFQRCSACGAPLRSYLQIAVSCYCSHSLSVIGQRLIDVANHPIGPVSMETRSGADVQEGVWATRLGCCCFLVF